jgi:hypothetical protein
MLLASLLCAALGLALSRASTKALIPSVLLLPICAVAAVYLMQEMPERQLMIGCAASILITALTVHLKHVPMFLALLLSANSGCWVGAVTTAAQPWLLLTLPVVLIVVPARWIVARHRTVVLKILSGWLVAVALLAATLPLITTAGYEPDHMD